MSRPRNFPISVMQGTSKSITFCFSDLPDLTSAQIQLVAKKHYSDTNFILCKDIDLEKSTRLEYGEFVISLIPDDTDNLISRSYVYEISIMVGVDKYIPIVGSFAVYDSIQHIG